MKKYQLLFLTVISFTLMACTGDSAESASFLSPKDLYGKVKSVETRYEVLPDSEVEQLVKTIDSYNRDKEMVKYQEYWSAPDGSSREVVAYLSFTYDEQGRVLSRTMTYDDPEYIGNVNKYTYPEKNIVHSQLYDLDGDKGKRSVKFTLKDNVIDSFETTTVIADDKTFFLRTEYERDEKFNPLVIRNYTKRYDFDEGKYIEYENQIKYEHLSFDKFGNWISAKVSSEVDGESISGKQTRVINYYE